MTKENKPFKLVALDLDGTLLDQRAQVPPRNVAAIKRAQAQGIGIILATGKTRESAVPVIEQLALSNPGVFFQGNLICDKDGRVLRSRSMPAHLAEAVLDYLQQEGYPVIVYDRGGLWTFTEGAHRDIVHTHYAEPLPRILPDRSESDGYVKFMISMAGRGGMLRRELKQRFGDDLAVLQAIPGFIEVMSPDVNKGEGVAWLLSYLGIEPGALLAIGDGENDVEMLQLAGCGVAMGNAPAHVQEAADAVTGSNDQAGVAQALERFVLDGQ